ncbi:enoyl-CoA hydratase/isomerase family protein [Duganella lactea]|nr:enoyl-CoA hydratase/isomerase family protein [Duganella lactea]
MNMITTHQNGVAITVLLATRAINPLSRLFQRELAALLDKLELRRDKLSAAIIGFDAEPNATRHEQQHLMALTPAQAADCMHMLAAYNALLQRIEHLGLPVVATLGGDISGHAFGLALACHHRFSLRDARFSLPQVRQGLTPVAGEIARTVRLAGLQTAAPLLLDGAVLRAAQALQAGLVHALADDEAELVKLANAAGQCRQRPPPAAPALTPAALRALLRERLADSTPAAEAILCAMVEGAQVDFDSALLIESRYFCQTAINLAPKKASALL